MELRIETYERLPPVATGDTPVVTGGLRWVSSTGRHINPHNERPTFYYFQHFNIIVSGKLGRKKFRFFLCYIRDLNELDNTEYGFEGSADHSYPQQR